MNRGEARQHEVQKDKRVNIELHAQRGDGVDGDPQSQDAAEQQNEGPTAAETRDSVGQSFPKSKLFIGDVVQVLCQNVVVTQTFDYFLFQRRQLTAFLL